MKTAIFYFSGTGNTKKVALKYSEELKANGHECELFALPLKQEIALTDYDLIGIGYPIHGFNAPQLMLQFAKSIEKSQSNPRAFIFKTSGEPVKMSRVSSLKLISILKKRGVKVTNEYQYVMPYNMIFRHTDHMAYVMWETAKRLIPIDCRDVLNGVERHEKKLFLGGLWEWFMRIEYGGFHFNGLFYKVKGDCISCGKCARNCPVGNIEMKDGKPNFGNNCIMCARCSFHCPANCIKIGLFDGWRVNGEYSFEDGDPNEKNGHENYCKKAYARYFKEAEERINNSKPQIDSAK